MKYIFRVICVISGIARKLYQTKAFEIENMLPGQTDLREREGFSKLEEWARE